MFSDVTRIAVCCNHIGSAEAHSSHFLKLIPSMLGFFLSGLTFYYTEEKQQYTPNKTLFLPSKLSITKLEGHFEKV